MSFTPFLIPKHSGIFLDENPIFLLLDTDHYSYLVGHRTYSVDDYILISKTIDDTDSKYFQKFVDKANSLIKKGNVIIHSDNLSLIRFLINSQDLKKLNLSVAISTGSDFDINIDNYEHLINMHQFNIDDLISKLASKQNFISQADKIIEETTELNLELIQLKKKGNVDDQTKVFNEIADVFNTLSIFLHINGMTIDDLEEYRKKQLLKHLK
jgi:phosphoribosyl-ATP pyrophosphohydrolase